ncbi:MAG: zinc-binding alcohol dehydrogenase [Chitinophagaceae bacterium]|nr:MAG: zinc-binding alcohol dehydrogenase [Chitinophagaceae bacterium]
MRNSIYVLEDKLVLKTKEEELDSEALAADSVLAKTLITAVSPGTELAAYQGLPPLRPGKVYPRVVGYCNVARVLRTGADVTAYVEGDIILTFNSHRSYFISKAADIICKLDPNEDLKHAVTAYLYHLAYVALLESGARAGMKVAILGGGTLGYNACQLAAAMGLQVTLFSGQTYLAAELEEAGIGFFDKSGDASAHAGAFDIVISTSNAWKDWFLALQLLRYRGTLACLGFPGRGEAAPDTNPLDSRWFYDKQLTIKSVGYVYEGDIAAHDLQFNLRRNMAYLLDLIRKKRINPASIISREVAATQLEELYQYLSDRQSRRFTGLLLWQ